MPHHCVMAGGDDWWQVAGLTVGPLYSVRINARTAVDLKAMVGLMAMTPVIDGYSTDNGTGSGFAVDLRAAVRYDVFTRWAHRPALTSWASKLVK